MMLQGAVETLLHEPRPIWIVEISTREHQPAGTKMNPNFTETFAMFFTRGYRAFTADDRQDEVTWKVVGEIAAGKDHLTTHNFLFR